MAIKIFPFLVALLAALLVAQTVTCEETDKPDLPDILFIENPDTSPKIINPTQALIDAPTADSRNRVCTALLCTRVCRALFFRFGRCNINRICICSNF